MEGQDLVKKVDVCSLFGAPLSAITYSWGNSSNAKCATKEIGF